MYQHFHKRKGKLAPDEQMWKALDHGRGLREILEDFYSRIYTDERLSGFFVDVTQERAIEKQYSFLRSIFTGEKCYFGDHPKKAHHWMVISEELFDYREQIMEQCLRRYGLSESLVQRWLAVEEVFRKVIVKSQPQDLYVAGRRIPAEGYVTERLDLDTVCDKCNNEVYANTPVISHARTGKVYCSACAQDIAVPQINEAYDRYETA